MIFWGSVIVGFALVLIVPFEEYPYASLRYVIFIVPVCLLAVGQILTEFKRDWIVPRIIKVIAVVSAAWTIFLPFATVYPNFNIADALVDRYQKRQVSEFYYYSNRHWRMPQDLYRMGAFLDQLTVRDKNGLMCYVAADDYILGSLYGSRLQNQIWNLQINPARSPDAYIFFSLGGKELTYIKQKILLADIARDDRFQLVYYQPGVEIYLKKDRAGVPAD